jgi:predicted Zn-dependent protease
MVVSFGGMGYSVDMLRRKMGRLPYLFVGIFLVIQTANLGAQPQSEGSTAPVVNTGQGFFNDALSSMDNAEAEASPEDVYFLGRAVAAHILSAYKIYEGNPELTRYLNRICQTLAINSSYPAMYNGYHVAILNSPEFNAFATPGGHIFITKGLVESTDSEDMLAAVIAHELAHIILSHGLKLIDDMKLASEAADKANRAAAIAGNSAGAQRLVSYRNSVSQMLDTLMKNGYSQPQEFEADRYAMALLAASGYDPGALAEILKVLQRVQKSQSGGFNITHPSPENRVANIQRITARQVQDTRPYRKARFKNK